MSLTLAEARERAALLSDVAYDIHLDVTDRSHFGVRTTVRFSCRTPGATTFLELARAVDVTVDGEPASYADGRITLTGLGTTNEVVVEARVPYVTDGDGFHTFTDPADGETYVSAYVGMDIAQRVFPCFDQNDLKGPLGLTVTAPPEWTVLANGRTISSEDGEWAFTPTPPLPPAMFVICAGPWHSYRWEHAGLPFGWHARRSLAAELDRDAAELRRITETCFDHYAELFDEPYAYDSFDQALVPGQNWGAQETPGCVTYRDEYLPVGRVSEGDARRRGMVIAHEMAHMWFGDLVTMTWWEDTWLQESFADYMGFRVSQDAAGFPGTFVDFTVSRKPYAYYADGRRSTHPVAPHPEDVNDVDEAANNFDAISYAKGNSVIRQLVTWLGDEAFLAGTNAYLSRHAHGNATLDDYVGQLDAVTDRDVRGWVEAWLRTTGFDTLRVERTSDGPVLVREGSRPHRVRVAAYDADLRLVSDDFVDVADAPVPLPDVPVLVPNSGGETYASVRLDPRSWDALALDLASVPEEASRALVWATAMDMVHHGDLPAEDFLGLVTRHLPREGHVATVESVAGWTRDTLLARHVPAEGVIDGFAQLAAACESGLASEPHDEIALALTRVLAASTPDSVLLEGWLVDRETHTGITLDPRLRWTAIRRLAALGAIDADTIEEERLGDGTVLGDLGAAGALASRPTEQAKAEAWERMYADPDLNNRVFESMSAGFWQPEQAALVHPYVERYLAVAPQVARERGQAYSQLVGRAFPGIPVTPRDVAALESALTGDVPTVLRRYWEDRLDDLRRLHG